MSEWWLIQDALQKKETTIDLSSWRVSLDGVKALANAIQTEDNRIERLLLSGNFLGQVGMSILSTGLIHPNNRVSALLLKGNRLGLPGVSVLHSCLIHPANKLRFLELDDNKITSDGAVVLANAMNHRNCKLNVLFLRQNDLDAVGVNALLASIKASTLEVLDLGLDRRHQSLQRRVEMMLKVKNWEKKIVTLLSVRELSRLGSRSGFERIPPELIRRIAEFLPFE